MAYPLTDPQTDLLIHQKCGCKKYFHYARTRRHFGGDDSFEGITKWWEHCPYHRKVNKVGDLKVELKKAQTKVDKLQDIIEKYPALIKDLEKEIEEKKLDIDTTVITKKTTYSYLP